MRACCTGRRDLQDVRRLACRATAATWLAVAALQALNRFNSACVYACDVNEELAILALGSSRAHRSGAYRISPACRRVVAEAERLAAQLDPRAVVFTGWSPDESVPEAEQMRARWRGPAVELVVEPTASSTAENAARTLPLLRERGIRHAVVVSTPLHLYRARWFFQRLFHANGIETTFRAARVLPTPGAAIWELAALSVRSRQLRAARHESENSQRSP
jgi:uncharacterized SAM-binding protein YcdF (DUF218 family)